MEAVKTLCGMGFSRTQAVAALEEHGYDVQRALNSLLGMFPSGISTDREKLGSWMLTEARLQVHNNLFAMFGLDFSIPKFSCL